MLTIFFIFLCVGTNVQAEFIKSDFNLSKEIDKISETTLSRQDLELMTGIHFKPILVLVANVQLIKESATTIGLEELRAALKLPTSPPWKHYNATKPSEHELASAETVEDYYNLREPRSQTRSLDSCFFYEENIDRAVGLLDMRLPSLRAIFEKTFEPVPEVLDKEAVDIMLEKFNTTVTEVETACAMMMMRSTIFQSMSETMLQGEQIDSHPVVLKIDDRFSSGF